MTTITFDGSTNPEGLISLANSLPCEFSDTDYRIVFPSGYLYTTPFPIIAAWSKRAPDGTRIILDVGESQEAARRLVSNVGLKDIVEDDLEGPRHVFKGASNVPLQPIVVGHSTEEALDRVYHMVDDWAGYQRDISAFKTILSELAENILVHSEAATPGYLHAKVHQTSQGPKCEITFADSGIGVLNSYLEGTNEEVKKRISGGASPLRIALDGMNTSKPREASPGGRSYFGFGLYTVKRLIELNRGRMTMVSGNEYLTLDRYNIATGALDNPWHGTIVALVIDLANPLPLEDVYEEESNRIVPANLLTPSDQKSAVNVSQEVASSGAQPAIPITKEKHTLVMRNFATKFLSRETGLGLRAELATLLVDGTTVEVDLDGVEDMTPSVADECFGKLAARLGEARYHRLIIPRGGSPLLHRLIEFVVANRLKVQ